MGNNTTYFTFFRETSIKIKSKGAVKILNQVQYYIYALNFGHIFYTLLHVIYYIFKGIIDIN